MKFLNLRTFSAAVFASMMAMAPAGAFGQNTTTVDATPASESDSSPFDALSFRGNAKLLVGNSSNVGLLSEETPATFVKIGPSLGVDWEPSESLVITLSGEANFKRYGSEEGKLLGNESFYDARIEALYFLSDSWELGGDLSLFTIENQVASISETGVNESVPQKYTEPAARVYAAWFGTALSVEAAAYVKNRTYATSFTDQQGKVYKNDFLEYRGEGAVGYRFSEDTRARFQIMVGEERYSDKQASFSEGLESFANNPHPLLKIFYHEYAARFESLLGSVGTRTKLGAKFNVDQIFGAESYVQYKIQQRFQVPIFESLTLTPVASLALKDFEFYRSNPIQQAGIKPTRRDIEFRGAADLAYTITPQIGLTAHYEFNRLVSNYSTLTYSEHQVESGVNVRF